MNLLIIALIFSLFTISVVYFWKNFKSKKRVSFNENLNHYHII
jgi:hypothetical protein